jgi:hypothetical protein
MFSAFDVLPTIAIEMGRFESAIVSQLGSIEAALQSAFRNGDLFEEGYNTLRNFARQELSVLQLCNASAMTWQVASLCQKRL